MKLNSFFQPKVQPIEIDESDSLNPFFDSKIEIYKENLKEFYGFGSLKTFAFTPDGIFGLLSDLKGKIGICVGESQFIIDGGKKFKDSGKDLEFVPLGFSDDNRFDYLFISPTVIDTFALQDLRYFRKTKIIANGSFFKEKLDVHGVVLDSLKVSGIGNFGALLFNEGFSENTLLETDVIGLKILQKACIPLKNLGHIKEKLLTRLKVELKDLDFFIQPEETHLNTLHIRLTGIKARELIRSLALEDVVISNGERCSLGFSNPSRIIREMGFSEAESREAISLSFEDEFSEEELEEIVKKISKKYRQIKALS